MMHLPQGARTDAPPSWRIPFKPTRVLEHYSKLQRRRHDARRQSERNHDVMKMRTHDRTMRREPRGPPGPTETNVAGDHQDAPPLGNLRAVDAQGRQRARAMAMGPPSRWS